MLDTAKTVREIAVELPQATRVFEKLGIDYCCGGTKTLEQACEAANLRLSEVMQSLDAATAPDATGTDWNQATFAELVAHITDKHHNYVKSEVPRLESLAHKVCSVHGANHPELLEVQKVFRAVGAELSMHMMKEEQILFPYLVHMEQAVQAGRSVPPPPFGSVGNPIHMMMMEHDSAGDALRELRRLTSDYAVPADGCISYQTLYRALLEFEADLHQHIHLENNILFPRAVEMENGRS
jgi:regulator of cell morphogenesis and NO signaling